MYQFYNSTPFRLSNHARQRMAERNYDYFQLFFVLQHGQCIDSHNGRQKYYLHQKNIPNWVNVNQMYNPLAGTIVIIDPRSKTIVTVYRDNQKMC